MLSFFALLAKQNGNIFFAMNEETEQWEKNRICFYRQTKTDAAASWQYRIFEIRKCNKARILAKKIKFQPN